MGSVYLAEHPTIGKKVALKVLHAEFSNNEEVAKRFFDEAKSVNNIGHPNIVDIVDYGVIQGGVNGRDQLVYFIMEYLAGLTLSQIIRSESPLPPERALMIAMQVADALGASHKCNIVHRDLKPDNIILVHRGRERDFVKLLDFGIAKLTDNSGQSSHKTRTGIVMGTPAYMSPEQCEGRPNVDSRTDIYALGVVLYEMLTGRVPFIGEGYGEILVQHLTQHPTPPSQFQMLDARIEVVVLKALEKRADLRYPTMEEFARAMADPYGYVAANGGPAEFLQRQLTPSNAPLPPVSRVTPYTPAPGLLSPPSGIYTSGQAVPTTLGASAGEAESLPPRKKTGFVIAALAILGAAGGGIAFVLANKDKGDPPVQPAAGSDVASGSDLGSNQIVEHGSGSAKVETGSGSAVADVGSGGGSAAGSGSAGSGDVANAGSGAEVGSGSAGSGSGSAAGSADTAPKLAKLVITSTPPGAAIWIDGKNTGIKTPDPVEVPQGKRISVSLKFDKYDTFNVKPFVVDKAEINHTFTLKKKATGNRGSGSGRTGDNNDTGLEVP